ncbi:MAG: hypothetical protein BWK78_01735 [Thiotrichaceae bacterium IS1]|nr:MAG: hypothetical protein BWK78_01735 [Thiotrichaceae bacterium IS1]
MTLFNSISPNNHEEEAISFTQEGPKQNDLTKLKHIHAWLSNTVTESKDKSYRHRLLKENLEQRNNVIDELKSYVYNAHEDVRQHLRKLAGISLDPLDEPDESDSFDPAKGYPETLNIETLKGYFGEIFAAIVAEKFPPFGKNWQVPAFLFRFHPEAFQRLESSRQKGENADKKIPGRTGDDNLAFEWDENKGQIVAILYCEAKCTSTHSSSLITEAHRKVSESEIVDIQQLIEILMEKSDTTSKQWVVALRRVRFSKTPTYKRYDLVNYVYGELPERKLTWIPTDNPHKEYKASRRLEAVEIHLHEVDLMVKEVYGKRG